MLHDRMLKPNHETCLKYKYKLKQITIRREKNVTTDKKKHFLKIGFDFVICNHQQKYFLHLEHHTELPVYL